MRSEHTKLKCALGTQRTAPCSICGKHPAVCTSADPAHVLTCTRSVPLLLKQLSALRIDGRLTDEEKVAQKQILLSPKRGRCVSWHQHGARLTGPPNSNHVVDQLDSYVRSKTAYGSDGQTLTAVRLAPPTPSSPSSPYAQGQRMYADFGRRGRS
jgi:hypothetical protein